MKLTAFFAFLFAALPATGFAQANCFEALIQNQGEISISDATDLALTSAYSRSLDSSNKWSAGVTVPIKGVPVSLTGDGARTLLERVTSSFSGQFSSNRLISMSTQTLSREAVEAFEICTRGADRTGTVVYAYDATQREITVEVAWNASANGPTTVPSEIVVVNGEFVSSPPDTMTSGESFRTVVRREYGEDVRIIANVGGTSSDATVYWVPNISVKTERQTAFIDGSISGGRWRLANQGDGKASWASKCSFPPNGWSVVPGTASANISDRLGRIDHRTYVRITEESRNRVCFEAQMYPLAVEGGGDMWWRPSYQIERVEVVIN